MSSTAEALRRARALIEDEEHWCQDRRTRVVKGRRQFCAFGALDEAVRGRFGVLRRFLIYAASELYGKPVTKVNDTLGHASVMHVYDRAIEMAEEQADAE